MVARGGAVITGSPGVGKTTLAMTATRAPRRLPVHGSAGVDTGKAVRHQTFLGGFHTPLVGFAEDRTKVQVMRAPVALVVDDDLGGRRAMGIGRAEGVWGLV